MLKHHLRFLFIRSYAAGFACLLNAIGLGGCNHTTRASNLLLVTIWCMGMIALNIGRSGCAQGSETFGGVHA